ncbi:hypothetical protein M0R72_17920 [Candidatus Pacearchaeota archaeon]|jgi:hypothetical protein|nr:hypothetical protein [Candidatus Pacearchaeota archaeon]
MASDEMIQVLRNHGVFAYGQESDIESMAEEWEDYDFSPRGADEWLSAGCFRAADARDLANAGISPEDAGKNYDPDSNPGISIGYAVANGDMTIDEVKMLVEEVA